MNKRNTLKIKVKRIISFIIVSIFSIFFTACQNNDMINTSSNDEKIKVIATNFPCYDFARAITKGNENVEIKMLLKPGIESHSYDPTPADIIAVENSDVFVYVGGESDAWVNKIIESIENENIKYLKMSDFVTMIPEEYKEGMQNESNELGEHEHAHDHEHEETSYDEHVWTSPINAIKIIEEFSREFQNIDEANKELYSINAVNYINEIKEIDKEFRKVVDNSDKKEIIFADRFPIIYFTKEYGLDYHAAFPGCFSESEVSAKTLSYLIDKIKEDDIKYVFHLELSNEKVASALCEQTGVETLLFHSVHNVSKEELENGESYVSLMKSNIERLKLALE